MIHARVEPWLPMGEETVALPAGCPLPGAGQYQYNAPLDPKQHVLLRQSGMQTPTFMKMTVAMICWYDAKRSL